MKLAALKSIRFKVWGGYAALGIVTAVVLFTIFLASVQTNQSIYQVTKESQPRAIAALEIATETERVLRLMTGYALSKDEASKNENAQALKLLRTKIGQYKAMLNQEADVEELKLIDKVVDQLGLLENEQKRLFLYVSSDMENIPALKVARKELEPIGQEVVVQVTDLILLAEESGDVDDVTFQALYEFRYNWINALSSARMFIALRDNVAVEQFDLYMSAVIQEKDGLEKFSKNADDDEVTELVEDLLDNVNSFERAFLTAKKYHTSDNWRQDSYLVRTSILPLANEIDEFLEQLLVVQEKNIRKATIALDVSKRRVQTSIIVAVVITIAISFIALLFSSRFVITPIMHLRKYLENISKGDADLHQRIEVLSSDELGQASSYFNDLMQSLESMLVGIKGASDQVLSAARSSSASLDGLHENCQQSAEHSGRVANVTEAMLGSTKHIRKQIDQSSQYVIGAEENISLGLKQMETLSDQAKNMANEITQMQERIEELSDQSLSMLGMVDVIKMIADQTNLLALNAAIEAARAGEAGRGFAVVADEVRTLATRTQESTDNITTMLQANAESGQNFVERIQKTVTETDQMIQSVEVTEKAMHEISQEIVKVVAVTDAVDNSVDQQGQMVEQVFSACNKSNDVIRENLHAIENIKSKVMLMNNSSEELAELLKKFKAG